MGDFDMILIFVDNVLGQLAYTLVAEFSDKQGISRNFNAFSAIVCNRKFIGNHLQILLGRIHFCWIQKIGSFLLACCLHVLIT
jgi:hypothetical protein